jgi:cysteinyl-tRNA synthetase
MDWTDHGVTESFTTLKSLYEDFDQFDGKPINHNLPRNFLDALLDDLNVPQAIAELHALKRQGDVAGLYASLRFLGFSCRRANVTMNVSVTISIPIETGATKLETYAPILTIQRADGTVELDPKVQQKILELIDARNAARARKDFKESDRIRDGLLAQGIVLKDTPQGTTWEVKR